MPIEIREETKRVSLVTIFGILVFYQISNLAVVIVPIIVISILFILDCWNKKTGIPIMEARIGDALAVIVVAAIAIVVTTAIVVLS